jgi:hypothetical protein
VTSSLQRQLAEFVNREDEMRCFCRMLEEQDKTVMVVWGDGGVGKSSLLAKMIHECASRHIPRAEVIWSDTRNHDYLAVMRKLRDDLGPEYFSGFTDLVNFFTVPQYDLKISLDGIAGDIRVAEGAQIAGSKVGDIAGIIIKDLMLATPRADMAVPESERMARLTDVFVEELAAVVTQGRGAVVLLDAAEKMSGSTRQWIWEELLGAARDGRLPGVNFVLCGREAPELDRDWRRCVELAQLKPLGREHIITYLGKRGVAEAAQAAVADMLLITTQGNILQIATHVDTFLEMQASHELPDV